MRLGRSVATTGAAVTDRRVEIPPPSAELALLKALLRAQLAALDTMKPKARQAFLRSLAETLAEYETGSSVVRIRGREYDAAVSQSRKEAAAWLTATLSAFFIADSKR
jgi:hypothetical protein